MKEAMATDEAGLQVPLGLTEHDKSSSLTQGPGLPLL